MLVNFCIENIIEVEREITYMSVRESRISSLQNNS